jgi:AcrR family transcriptional regulator
MAVSQKEKTEITHNQLKATALKLFLDKGYEQTGIKEIAENSGYAVGSFYRHWKSKQQILMEIWDDFASDFIRGSIENAPTQGNELKMVDYLIARSDQFAQHEITKNIFLTSQILSAQSGYEDISQWASKYTEMLYNFLKRISKSEDENKLRSTASIMHTILNAHAMQNTNTFKLSAFDNDTLACCLISIIKGCI